MQAQLLSPPPGPRTGFVFSSDFKNGICPNQNSTICAQGPDWAWLKDVTPTYLFEVAFYKFWRQRATAIAKIQEGAVKPCWHDEVAFKNECASVRSVGASLLRGSAEKGASAARALATSAKAKTTAVPDEEQPQQQQVQQQQLQQQAAVQQATLQLLQQQQRCRWPSNTSNNNNNRHRHRYALSLPLRALSTLLCALHLL